MERMQIGLDITSLLYHRGVSRYTRNLAESLLDAGVDLRLYGTSFRQRAELEDTAAELVDDHPSSDYYIDPYPVSLQRWLWRFGRNTVSSHFTNLDLFHSWDWIQPPDTTIPLVSTIHDLAILKFPETAHPRVKRMHEQSWKVLKQRQAHLIAVSAATKKDIIELLGYPGYLVHVIHEALPREIRQMNRSITEETAATIKQDVALAQPYILFVGTREPRKNLKRLIKAWEPLAADIQLIIVGEKGWDEEYGSLSAQAQKQLRFLGRVSDQVLSILYAEAELFAYPSLYEGFGLPILEAFHHGTPVVTSENSGMLEVAGNAACYVEPESIESIRAGLETILNENTEEQRNRLQRMIIRGQMFSWENVAQETINVYKRAIEDWDGN